MVAGEGAEHQQHVHHEEVRHDAQPAQWVALRAAWKGLSRASGLTGTKLVLERKSETGG